MHRLPPEVARLIMSKKADAEKLRLSVYAFRDDAEGLHSRWIYVTRSMSDPPGFATVTVADEAILCRNERMLWYIVRDAVHAILEVQSRYTDDEIPSRDVDVYYTQGGDTEHPKHHDGVPTRRMLGRQFYFRMHPTIEDISSDNNWNNDRMYTDVLEAIATLVLQA